MDTVDLETLTRLGKVLKAGEATYAFSVMFPKLSILSLYIRLFVEPTVRRLSYFTTAFVVASFVAGITTWGFTCQPFAFNWDKSIPGGHCIDIMKSYTYFSIPNLISDVAIILLPLHTIWKLQVPRSTKFGLFITFILGGL